MPLKKDDQVRLDEANKESVADLTERRKKEFISETEAYRNRLMAERAAADAKWKDDLAKKDKTIDPHTGKETTLWDDVLKKADACLNPEQNSYNDWRAAMTSLLASFGSLNKAIAVSFEQTRGEVVGPLRTVIRDKALFPVKDYLMDKIRGEPELDLPALKHKIDFKDGKVEIAKLTRSDGGKLEESDRINKSFETIVNIWLLDNGYMKRADGTFTNVNDGSALDAAKFNNLKNGIDDPKTSFADFLEKNADLQYEDSLGIGSP